MCAGVAHSCLCKGQPYSTAWCHSPMPICVTRQCIFVALANAYLCHSPMPICVTRQCLFVALFNTLCSPKVAVISGVGTRNYYRKLGYETEGEGEYMTKVTQLCLHLLAGGRGPSSFFSAFMSMMCYS